MRRMIFAILGLWIALPCLAASIDNPPPAVPAAPAPVATTPTAAPSDEVHELAVVNGDAIMSDQLVDAFANRHSGHAKFLGGDREARNFLKILIDERLLIQEGFNIGLDEDPSVKAKVDDYEIQKANDAFVTEEFDEKAKLSDADLNAAWNQLNFVVKGREVALVTRQEAEEVRNAILHGGNSEVLARECSHAESRAHGGIFTANWGNRDPGWEKVVFALGSGDLSPVIETPDGYEVVLVDARVDVEKPELKAIRESLEQVVKARKLDERKRTFSEELWTKYHVVTKPLERVPDVLLALRKSAPETVVATWDGGGSLKLADALDAADLEKWKTYSPRRAEVEIDSHIRSTVNDGLVTLEAKARGYAARPAVAKVVNRYRELLVQDALFREHIWKGIEATDADVTKYYEEHKADFVAPEKRHIAQVLVSKEAEAKKVYDKLAAGADFDTIVKQYSRDFTTAQNGGDLGWVAAEKVPADFKQVLSLKQGAIAKPVHSSIGWHVFKILEIQPAHQLALSEVREQAKAKALDAKQREAQKFWIDKLRQQAKIEIKDDGIKAFVKENQYIGQPPPQHLMQ